MVMARFSECAPWWRRLGLVVALCGLWGTLPLPAADLPDAGGDLSLPTDLAPAAPAENGPAPQVGAPINLPVQTPHVTNRNDNGRANDKPAAEERQKNLPTSVTYGPNEFQKFVQDSIGKLLPLYGADFFDNATVFTNQAAPVAADTPLGPGDEVLIRGWGAVDIDLRTVIDRNGLISIPKVGTVPLAGVRAGDAEGVLRTAIGRIYRDFNLSVTLGQLRGITIYVVGLAMRPGTYSVSSTSTLVTALFESGGPNPNGSMRRIQVKRQGQVVADMDLYAFLARGDKSADIRLLDGDVVVIPPALGHVALSGAVKLPAIYELREDGEPLSSLLDLGGGVPLVADPRRAFLEHLEPGHEKPRSIEEFALDAKGLVHPLHNGDLMFALNINPAFDNAVTLRGIFRLPFHPGMRITSLIPNREFLVRRQVTQKKNRANREGSAGIGIGYYQDINWDYAVVERMDPATMTPKLLSFNLGEALDHPNGPENLLLEPGDTVSVFSANDVQVPLSRRQTFVRVEGEVKQPGVYQVSAGETLPEVLAKAGGLTPDAYLFGAEFTRDSVRRAQQANLDRFIQRLQQQAAAQTNRTVANSAVGDPNGLQTQQQLAATQIDSLNRFVQRLQGLRSSGRLSLGLPTHGATVSELPELRLENGDRLFIPPRPEFVQVFGSVDTESALLWQPGRNVADYMKQAGISREADAKAVFVLRPDGTVVADRDSWFFSVARITVLPGDVIVVPEKLDLQSGWNAFMKGAVDWTTIFFNFGLGAAALKTLGAI